MIACILVDGPKNGEVHHCQFAPRLLSFPYLTDPEPKVSLEGALTAKIGYHIYQYAPHSEETKWRRYYRYLPTTTLHAHQIEEMS